MMKSLAMLLAGAAALALAGCGKKDAQSVDASVQSEQTQATADTKNSKEPFFSPELKKPNCMLPSTASTGGAGFDIGGVRLGMGREEALRVVYCDGRQKFNYQTSKSFFDLDVEDGRLGAQTVTIHDGVYGACDDSSVGNVGGHCRYGEEYFRDIKDEVDLSTPGFPGQERVVSVSRSETFDKPPTYASVAQGLIAKFGQPTEQADGSGVTYLTWQWTTDGQLKAPKTEGQYGCASHFSLMMNSTAFTKGCGLTVQAEINRESDNNDLAAGYIVAMMDQDKTYAAMQAMQATLSAEKAAKQRQELQSAQSSGDKPSF